MKNRLKFLSLLLVVFAVACNNPNEPEQPEQPEQPADPNAVTMTDIEILDMQGTYADFSVVVRNMDSFGYMVIPTEEYTEKSVAEVIAGSGQFSLDDGNFSWEEEMTIVFGVDTTPLDRLHRCCCCQEQHLGGIEGCNLHHPRRGFAG